MGILLGLGVILGVRCAVAGSPFLLAGPVAFLLISAWRTSPPLRGLCLAAALGCVVGFAAGTIRTGDAPPPITTAEGDRIRAEILSDPAVEPTGVRARVEWTDRRGYSRTSSALFPTSPAISRGATVVLNAEVEGTRGGLLWVTSHTIVEQPSSFEHARQSVRSRVSETLSANVPGSAGSLALGLLIGDDSGLTTGERQDLRDAGLSHITAVSGWNVMLVTAAVGALFLALGLRGWRWTTLQLVALVFYVWVVGLDPPVVRAAIMATTALVALRLGRPAHGLTILTLSAAGMVVVSPSALSSLSFRLSVLATLALIARLHLAPRWGGRHGWRAYVVTPMVASFGIGVATAPLLAATFGTATLASIPANVLAAPLIPIATVLSVVTVLASFVAPIGQVAGIGAWVVCEAVLLLSSWFSRVPLGHWSFTPLPSEVMAVLYAALVLPLLGLVPEGRLVGRRLARWSADNPGPAGIALLATTVSLLSAALAS